MAEVPGRANSMFISSIGVFSLIVIPMLLAAGGRDIVRGRRVPIIKRDDSDGAIDVRSSEDA